MNLHFYASIGVLVHLINFIFTFDLNFSKVPSNSFFSLGTTWNLFLYRSWEQERERERERERENIMTDLIPFSYLKRNFPISTSVRLSVGLSVGLPVCHHFKFHFPCSYRSIALVYIYITFNSALYLLSSHNQLIINSCRTISNTKIQVFLIITYWLHNRYT